MHHRWQRIHCDRCLEEMMSAELAELSRPHGRICTHGTVASDLHDRQPDPRRLERGAADVRRSSEIDRRLQSVR